MEDLLHNIYNIDDTHVSDHHNTEEYTCERPSVINEEAWKGAQDAYRHSMNKYNKLYWFQKIFTRKPQMPSYVDFIRY